MARVSSGGFFKVLLDVAKPPGYRGSLVDEGEGSFVRLLVRAPDEEEAVEIAKAYVEDDGARLLTIEEVIPLDPTDRMPLEAGGLSRYEVEREIDGRERQVFCAKVCVAGYRALKRASIFS